MRGLQYVPQKIRNLSEINKILAHTPWNLDKSHIEVSLFEIVSISVYFSLSYVCTFFLQKVTKGRESWSIGELCQILVLMAHYHCLCSFVFASEILIEMDDNPEKSYAVISDDDDDNYEVIFNCFILS